MFLSILQNHGDKGLGQRGQWAICKHLYFVFTIISNLNSDIDAFTHAPSFSFNEVKRFGKQYPNKPYSIG